LDYASKLILEPLIEVGMQDHVNNGNANCLHWQNTHLEIDSEGKPTGRIAIADLISSCPHPGAAEVLKRKDYYKEKDIPFVNDRGAEVFYSFHEFLWKMNLLPIAKCLAEHCQVPFDEAKKHIVSLLREAAEKRRDIITAPNAGPLAEFAHLLDDNAGEYLDRYVAPPKS
jgi:hypothetical protein